MHKILYCLQVAWLTVSYRLRRTYLANMCGEKTKKTGEILSCGESLIISLPLSRNGNPDYCLSCVAKMSIKCAWCGNLIHIGDPVTLYLPQESFKIPEYAVRYDKDERCLVGCLGFECTTTGADRQGFWVPPGKVKRVASPIETMVGPIVLER